MSLIEWLMVVLVIQVIHFLGTWKFYVAAGKKPWQAVVPLYNAMVLMRIIKKPWWWTLLLFIPIVNLIMFPVLWVELLSRYGKTSTIDTLLVILTGGLYLFYVNYTQELTYLEDEDLKKPSLRISFSYSSTYDDIDALISGLKSV